MRNTLLRRAATLATTLGLTAAGLLGAGTAPAQAAVSDCPVGYFCAWVDEYAKGAMLKTQVSMPTLGTWDNKLKSSINRTNLYSCQYDDPNYGFEGGALVDAPRQASVANSGLGLVSSIKLVPTERECSDDAYPYWEAKTSPTVGGFGDMNGDRRADVLLRDSAGRLWLMPGNGTGRMIGSGGWGAYDLLRHGDFSRDGREDVIAREKSTGKLWLYPGTGGGPLGARKLIGSSGWNSMGPIAAFGDLTGDARPDVLAVEKSTGKLWVYAGTSTGTLAVRKAVGSSGWNAMNALVGAGDLTGDGLDDLLAREKATGKLWLYPGTSRGIFGTRKAVGSNNWNYVGKLFAVGDRSGDGRPDLQAADLSTLYQYLGSADGSLSKSGETYSSWWLLEGAQAF
ncbi:FG-GAP-like repeat-containing protein [Streptomyces sp. NPDC056144]|uniref:FG-GAP-like repeat-containing protein n=1 Tax=unclassified Streptomyces TaxID=2593676 RepID=UPI0035E2AE67